MAFERAYTAIKHCNWHIVTEMLDKGELSIEDFKNQHDYVRYLWSARYTYSVYVCAIVVDDVLLARLFIRPHMTRDRKTPTARSCDMTMHEKDFFFWDELILPFLLSTVPRKYVADLCSRERSSRHRVSSSACRSRYWIDWSGNW